MLKDKTSNKKIKRGCRGSRLASTFGESYYLEDLIDFQAAPDSSSPLPAQPRAAAAVHTKQARKQSSSGSAERDASLMHVQELRDKVRMALAESCVEQESEGGEEAKVTTLADMRAGKGKWLRQKEANMHNYTCWGTCNAVFCAAGEFSTWSEESKDNREDTTVGPSIAPLSEMMARKVIKNYDKLVDQEEEKNKIEEVKKAYRKNSINVILTTYKEDLMKTQRNDTKRGRTSKSSLLHS
ncbi:unnamed protein product [Amoebophrya sp. A25]|nr:unnamed protein product [Amoebophrya sp. A25]|eukprot:GSA25T00006348001.1